ncbi:P-type DNA transfer protein VirB5 [Pseudomonas oryzihabitans]|uniref:P-type DNA transfer protein VirB5 n=1 Tax=Pseudomonas oryzihabitans TaxID=47885 RepID=UPI0009DFA9CF|nr:P-type DNA transfer protein VirB5 [Pseudomonas oryzihabitans]NMZ47703.1 P-type DNA transfer protein VirB5 [Pseudomonas oryzihabitans]
MDLFECFAFKGIRPFSCATALALTLGSQQGYAQIPVTVTTQVTDSPMTVAEFASNATRWAQQVQQMTSQIDQMKQQYGALTGSRGLGRVFDDPQLREYLPQAWQAVYDAVKHGGYSGLNGRAGSIYADNKVFDACENIVSDQQRYACRSQAVKPSQDKAFALEAYDQAEARVHQIDQLMGTINKTQDPKGIAELQGRIAAEQAMIQNEQAKLQMFQMVAEAEGKIQEQRQRELNAQVLDKRGYKNRELINLGGQLK